MTAVIRLMPRDPVPRARNACIGECMIEISRIDLENGSTRLGFAGDTLNTAIYLARPGCDVSYLTNLGTDAFSGRMVRQFVDEGISDSFNAGYLSARLRGDPPAQAAAAGHRLALAVIGHPGAVIPRGAMPPAQPGT